MASLTHLPNEILIYIAGYVRHLDTRIGKSYSLNALRRSCRILSEAGIIALLQSPRETQQEEADRAIADYHVLVRYLVRSIANVDNMVYHMTESSINICEAVMENPDLSHGIRAIFFIPPEMEEPTKRLLGLREPMLRAATCVVRALGERRHAARLTTMVKRMLQHQEGPIVFVARMPLRSKYREDRDANCLLWLRTLRLLAELGSLRPVARSGLDLTFVAEAAMFCDSSLVLPYMLNLCQNLTNLKLVLTMSEKPEPRPTRDRALIELAYQWRRALTSARQLRSFTLSSTSRGKTYPGWVLRPGTLRFLNTMIEGAYWPKLNSCVLMSLGIEGRRLTNFVRFHKETLKHVRLESFFVWYSESFDGGIEEFSEENDYVTADECPRLHQRLMRYGYDVSIAMTGSNIVLADKHEPDLSDGDIPFY